VFVLLFADTILRYEHFECLSDKSLQFKIQKNYLIKNINEWHFYLNKPKNFNDDSEQAFKMMKTTKYINPLIPKFPAVFYIINILSSLDNATIITRYTDLIPWL
jgi:hypothetical protein